jgi:hypothetical protein
MILGDGVGRDRHLAPPPLRADPALVLVLTAKKLHKVGVRARTRVRAQTTSQSRHFGDCEAGDREVGHDVDRSIHAHVLRGNEGVSRDLVLGQAESTAVPLPILGRDLEHVQAICTGVDGLVVSSCHTWHGDRRSPSGGDGLRVREGHSTVLSGEDALLDKEGPSFTLNDGVTLIS